MLSSSNMQGGCTSENQKIQWTGKSKGGNLIGLFSDSVLDFVDFTHQGAQRFTVKWLLFLIALEYIGNSLVDLDLYLISKPLLRRVSERRLWIAIWEIECYCISTTWKWDFTLGGVVKFMVAVFQKWAKGIKHWMTGRREPASDWRFPRVPVIFPTATLTEHLRLLRVDRLMHWWCPKGMGVGWGVVVGLFISG